MNDIGTLFRWCSDCRERGRAVSFVHPELPGEVPLLTRLQRGRLRRERKKAIIDSFHATAQANPQLAGRVFGELGKLFLTPVFVLTLTMDLAVSQRSAFSRRNPIRLLLNPPSPSAHPAVQSSETLSTSLETEETESTISESEQAGPSRTSHSLYLPPQSDPIDDPTQLDHQFEAEEYHEDNAAVSVTIRGPTYFICFHCSIARKTSLGYDGICLYCLEHEQKYCITGGHEADRCLFTDSEGNEQSSCRNCRERDFSHDEMVFSRESDDE